LRLGLLDELLGLMAQAVVGADRSSKAVGQVGDEIAL